MEWYIFSICLDILLEIQQRRWFQCECTWLMFETQGFSDYLLSHARQMSDNISIVCDRSMALPKRVLHRVWSGASSSKFQYLIISWQSFGICFISSSSSSHHLYPPVYVSFNRVCLCKMWPIQLAFFRYIVFVMFLPNLTVRNTFSYLTRSV